MDCHENPPQQRIRPSGRPSFSLIFLLSVLIAILAILIFALYNSNYNSYYYFYINRIRSRLIPENGIPRFQWFSMPNMNANTRHQVAQNPPKSPYCLLWMAPFLSSGGYSSEAWSYVTALHDYNHINVVHNNNHHNPSPLTFRLGIEHHGDLESIEFWEGLPERLRTLAIELHQYPTYCHPNETIVVCHSEPGAWYPPLFQTNPCPPSARYNDFLAVIGRTMFETDRVNMEHVRRCNLMDFVWVPTDFHVSSFVNSGVDESKVVKLVQSVDVTFFDPHKFQPLVLPSLAKLVLGRSSSLTLNSVKGSDSNAEFVFLSIFKWEYRKGWDVLLKAYLEEFTQLDGVSLYLLTNAYHTDGDFGNKIVEFLDNDPSIQKPLMGWAPVYVIDTHIAQVDMPRLFKSADAFVLPSRGEGWGRPIVEAMAMSLPVITTNFSGPTEYLTKDNSYPLIVDKLSKVKEGPFEGHLWAEPSVDGLRVLMRHVMSNVEEAKNKGRCAREDMISRYSPQNVAETLSSYIQAVLSERT